MQQLTRSTRTGAFLPPASEDVRRHQPLERERDPAGRRGIAAPAGARDHEGRLRCIVALSPLPTSVAMTGSVRVTSPGATCPVITATRVVTNAGRQCCVEMERVRIRTTGRLAVGVCASASLLLLASCGSEGAADSGRADPSPDPTSVSTSVPLVDENQDDENQDDEDQGEVDSPASTTTSAASPPTTMATLYTCPEQTDTETDQLMIDYEITPDASVLTFDSYELGDYDRGSGGSLIANDATQWSIGAGGEIIESSLTSVTVYITASDAEAVTLAGADGQRLGAALVVDNFLGTDEQMYGHAVFASSPNDLVHISRCPDSVLHRQYEELPSKYGATELTAEVLLRAIADADSGLEPPATPSTVPAPAVFADGGESMLLFIDVELVGAAPGVSALVCFDQPGATLDGWFCVDTSAAGGDSQRVNVPLFVDPELDLEYWLAARTELEEIPDTRGEIDSSLLVSRPDDAPSIRLEVRSDGDSHEIEILTP